MKKLVGLIVGASIAVIAAIPAMAAEPAGNATAAPAATDKSPATAPAAADTPLPGPRLSPAAPSGARIGFVDMEKIAKDSIPGKAAAVEMKKRTNTLRNQMQSREKQLSKQKAAIESTIASMSPAQRQAKAKEFQKKITDYQKFVQKAGKEIQAREEQLLGNLYKSTREAAEENAKANGYAAVVIKKELLYLGDTTEVIDVTEEIIKLLDKKSGIRK